MYTSARRAAAMCLVAPMLFLVPTGQAGAAADPRIDEIVALNPGTTRSEIEQTISTLVAESGQSRDEIITEALTELRDNAATTEEVLAQQQAASPDVVINSSNPGGERILGPAKRAGDIWWASNHILGYNAGHNGIYHTTDSTVEALTTKVTSQWANKNKTVAGAQKKYVITTQAIRNKAAAWAYSKRGSAYNLKFLNNKKLTAPYNCSQLVWAAYIASGGPDLDSDGGRAVMPDDILKSSHTRWYETVR